MGEPVFRDKSSLAYHTHTLTVNIQIILREDFRALINGLARSVEDTSQHVLRYWQLHTASSELDVRSLDIYA